MVLRTIGESGGNQKVHPIMAGAAVGLITGFIGIFATMVMFSAPVGGLVGAVSCGITVASISEMGPYEVVVHAVIADMVSSIAFFSLVLITYLTMVWLTEGLAIISAIWFSMVYLVLGGLAVAVPVGVVSLGITGVSAIVTSLVKKRLADQKSIG